MATSQLHRLDELPLDRRVAGEARGLVEGPKLPAIFERRDVDPIAAHLKRRHGSLRTTNTVPNLLGVAFNGDEGSIEIDRDFATEIAENDTWTIFGTFRAPVTTNITDSYAPLFTLNGVHAFVKHIESTNSIHVKVYSAAGSELVTTGAAPLSVSSDFRFVVKRTSTNIKVGAWYVPAVGASASIGADVSASHTFDATASQLKFFGAANLASLTPAYKGVVLNNVLFYDADVFAETSSYEAIASDITPDTSITSPGTTKLLWHDTFGDGGNVLDYSNDADTEVNAYLVPSAPVDFSSDPAVDPTVIHFGGKGVIEIPFYLDFDEYYWTSASASARLDWCFQLTVTTPAILNTGSVFEFQDLVHLNVTSPADPYYFACGFNNNTVTVTSTVALAGNTTYNVFVARDANYVYLKVNTTEVNAASTNPIVFSYDKTLGFIIGDKVDFETTAPFGGKIGTFALHNLSTRIFHPKATSVLYYDVISMQGDEVIDQGNRSLNSFAGIRSSTQPPFYREGGFLGGGYVAATGGYIISNSSPSIGYTGQLSKPLTKDAVVQRRGRHAFLTSNEVSYIVDDFSNTFRPLGLPRPSTKVSCTPQGVGPIDGFVRYAYRFITQDGTVGPVFELDPCDATGGVNVFLGADTFGIPDDSAFGLSYGELQGKDTSGRGDTALDTVETFIAHDQDTTGDADPSLLHVEKKFPGLTIETAVRLPKLGSSVTEGVISQGVHMPFGPDFWMADNTPKNFPWIGGQGQECCFQFTFRFQTKVNDPVVAEDSYQTLFGIGARDQKYSTGWGPWSNTHYRLNHLVVSIQPPASVSNEYSIVVTRDDPTGSEHRDNDLVHWALDYDFEDNSDYTIFVSRGGSLWGAAPGADLAVAIFNHTKDGTDDGAGGTFDGWALWPHDIGGGTQQLYTNFWDTTYVGDARDEIMWGACRHEGTALGVKTRKRAAAGSTTFNFATINAFQNGTALDGTGGQRMYHGRMWRQDFSLTLLANKALDRYGARTGPLSKGIEVDLAFCPDSSVATIDGGWDYTSGIRVKYYAPNATNASTILTDTVEQSVFLAYGFNNTIDTSANPDAHTVTSLDKIPLWCTYTSRNEGSLVIGTGQYPAVEVGKTKWHSGSGVLTYDDFANAIDLSEWTWLTIYFHQIFRVDSTTIIDVWIERVFIDGYTGPWGDLFNSDTSLAGPGGKTNNTTAGPGQFTLFTSGGAPGISSDFELEVAEVRLWDGERYTAFGGGGGSQPFGPYMSTRVPPNSWDKLWHYLRFAPLDVDDMASQATMDQLGIFKEEGGVPQKSSDAVAVYQGAEVKEGTDADDTGSSFFIPFPEPPTDAIRGIEIFRTQIVPVTETYPSGEANPNAITDAFKACRAAPLYYLTEIPDGTNFYFDSAIDTLLGGGLDLTEGLIPKEPKGVFEWHGYLGIWIKSRPRIHFAASPDSWESFPSDMVLDLPLREYGPIEAATELASRDARQSRVLVLGKSWGVFLDGSPTSPLVNSLGGGVGAATSRCLVVEKGIAYAYNGTLWAITGDGQIEDIGLPVLDLLPPVNSTRLAVSSALGSLFVINEDTGLALRWHFARREWFVEDRYGLSVTDIDGEDYWVSLTGYPSVGLTTVYGDDLESNTAASYTVSSFDNGANTVTVSSITGIKVGQRITLVANQDPRERQAITVSSISSATITTSEDLDLTVTGPDSSGATVTFVYTGYVGVGEWGTMLDTGQFINKGALEHVDLGITSGTKWYAMFDAAAFAKDPTDRSGFDASESFPTLVDDGLGGGQSARWGLNNRQRIQRLLFWSPVQSGAGLSELELTYTQGEPL